MVAQDPHVHGKAHVAVGPEFTHRGRFTVVARPRREGGMSLIVIGPLVLVGILVLPGTLT